SWSDNIRKRCAGVPPRVGSRRVGDGASAANRMRLDAAGVLEITRGTHRASSGQRDYDASITAGWNVHGWRQDHGFLEEIGRAAREAPGGAVSGAGFWVAAAAKAEYERHRHRSLREDRRRTNREHRF